MHSFLFFNLLTATQQMEFRTHSCVATHSLSFTWLALCAHAHQISAEARHPPSKTTLNASDQVRVLISNPYICLCMCTHMRVHVCTGGDTGCLMKTSSALRPYTHSARYGIWEALPQNNSLSIRRLNTSCQIDVKKSRSSDRFYFLGLQNHCRQ